MKKHIFLLLIVLLAGLLSCGSDAAKDKSPNEIGFEDFQKQAIQALATLSCKQAFECPKFQDPPFVVQMSRAGTQENCVAKYGAVRPLNEAFVDQKLGIAAGRMEFNAANAARCLTVLETLGNDCQNMDDINQQIASVCGSSSGEGPFVGLRTPGQPCLSGDECTSGRCDRGNDSTCYGTCEPRVTPAGAGESCEAAECAPELLCVIEMEGSDAHYVCEPRHALKSGDTCHSNSARCPAGHLCSIEDDTCVAAQPGAGEGEECDLGLSICRPGMVCVTDTLDSPTTLGTCVRPTLRGEPCAFMFQCELGLYCTEMMASGTCEPQKTEGAACSGLPGECAVGLQCDNVTQKCKAGANKAACEVPEP